MMHRALLLRSSDSFETVEFSSLGAVSRTETAKVVYDFANTSRKYAFERVSSRDAAGQVRVVSRSRRQSPYPRRPPLNLIPLV